MKNYKNPELPVKERVDDLVARMSVEEKVSQLFCMMVRGEPSAMLGRFPFGVGEIGIFGGGDTAREMMEQNKKIVDYVIEHTPHNIPPMIHIEAITGLVGPETTVFPSAIGLGATFAPETVQEMGDIIRKQMISSGFRRALSPVMDIGRDPRWGRIGETYGEDPTLASAMSVAFVKGLQGDNLKEGVAATGKHFLGYSLSDGGLNMASNPIPERDLREVYAKPFQAAITEADLVTIMNSYGTVNNDLVTISEHILTDLLRGELGFDGAVVSDYMSIQHVPQHRLAADMEESAVLALKAGMDVEMPFPASYSGIIKAVKMGQLDEAYVDKAVRRVLEAKFKLGLFENPYPFEDLFEAAYTNTQNREHSLKTARESIVMVKNDGILPLSKKIKKIAVVGPHADSLRLLFGCYTHPAALEMDLGRAKGEMAGMGGADQMAGGAPVDDGFVQSEPMQGSGVLKEHTLVTEALEKLLRGKTPTILESLKSKNSEIEITYSMGCEIAGTDQTGFDEAVKIAKDADVVIYTAGGKYGWGRNCTVGEGIDTDHIGLPDVQEKLAKQLHATGTPCIMVHMDARPLSSEFISTNYAAVLENWFPGSTGGDAIADVLFGDYNPAGRLPVTIARNTGQIPIHIGQKIGNSYFTDGMNMKLARYTDSEKTPLHYFGEGLSYTTFEYSNLEISGDTTSNGTVDMTFNVTNTGAVDGDEVTQLYVSDLLASMVRPALEFAGCHRVFLKARETKKIRFTVRADQFAFMNKNDDWVVEQGEMLVQIGGSSTNLPLEGKFNIEDSAVIDPQKRGFYAKSEVV